jgi:hypothetical protein
MIGLAAASARRRGKLPEGYTIAAGGTIEESQVGTGGSRTLRWRKADSNRWSHLRQRC